MFILCKWARECGNTSQLPISLSQNPLIQSMLIDYVDKFLNQNIRKN
jgi:hypothetical protein